MILILFLVNVLFLNRSVFLSDNIFYSNINTDINITWTTSLVQFYGVLAPSTTTIYTLLGDILPHHNMNKYKINSKGTEQIDISVLNVSQNDGGIYQSVSLPNSNVDGCCLLIITGLYIMFYIFIIKKCMWRNEFFGLSIYLEEYGVFKSEKISKTWI